MHYTGMEAMRMDAVLRYDPWLFAAGLMSGAVPCMHYTGMTAAYFFPGQSVVSIASPMDTTLMVPMIALVTILVLGITIYGVVLDSWRRISLLGQKL